MWVVALLGLDAAPGVDGRRVLLAAPPGTAGLSAAAVAFPTGPADIVSAVLNIPRRKVSPSLRILIPGRQSSSGL